MCVCVSVWVCVCYNLLWSKPVCCIQGFACIHTCRCAWTWPFSLELISKICKKYYIIFKYFIDLGTLGDFKDIAQQEILRIIVYSCRLALNGFVNRWKVNIRLFLPEDATLSSVCACSECAHPCMQAYLWTHVGATEICERETISKSPVCSILCTELWCSMVLMHGFVMSQLCTHQVLPRIASSGQK